VSECDREASIMRRAPAHQGLLRHGERKSAFLFSHICHIRSSHPFLHQHSTFDHSFIYFSLLFFNTSLPSLPFFIILILIKSLIFIFSSLYFFPLSFLPLIHNTLSHFCINLVHAFRHFADECQTFDLPLCASHSAK
jgi:hypothetical protein